jgi:hypothetical protein
MAASNGSINPRFSRKNAITSRSHARAVRAGQRGASGRNRGVNREYRVLVGQGPSLRSDPASASCDGARERVGDFGPSHVAMAADKRARLQVEGLAGDERVGGANRQERSQKDRSGVLHAWHGHGSSQGPQHTRRSPLWRSEAQRKTAWLPVLRAPMNGAQGVPAHCSGGTAPSLLVVTGTAFRSGRAFVGWPCLPALRQPLSLRTRGPLATRPSCSSTRTNNIRLPRSPAARPDLSAMRVRNADADNVTNAPLALNGGSEFPMAVTRQRYLRPGSSTSGGTVTAPCSISCRQTGAPVWSSIVTRYPMTPRGPSNRSVVPSASVECPEGYKFRIEEPRTRVAAEFGGTAAEAMGETTGSGGKGGNGSTPADAGRPARSTVTRARSFNANRAPLVRTSTTRVPLLTVIDAPSPTQS